MKKNKQTDNITIAIRCVRDTKKALTRCRIVEYDDMTLQEIEDMLLKILGKQEFLKHEKNMEAPNE